MFLGPTWPFQWGNLNKSKQDLQLKRFLLIELRLTAMISIQLVIWFISHFAIKYRMKRKLNTKLLRVDPARISSFPVDFRGFFYSENVTIHSLLLCNSIEKRLLAILAILLRFFALCIRKWSIREMLDSFWRMSRCWRFSGLQLIRDSWVIWFFQIFRMSVDSSEISRDGVDGPMFYLFTWQCISPWSYKK